MSRHAGALARRSSTHHHAPRTPRRISGPVAAAHRGAVVARPPLIDLGGRVRALPDSTLLDKLLHSRAWIWLIGLALGGIVAMQVSLLKLNHGISRAVESAATLERQNAQLEAQIAKLSSGERIQAVAAKHGMVLPDAGSVRYLSVRPDDARRAAARMQAPSAEARALMERGGLAAPTLTVPVATAETAPATTAPAVATPAPTATETVPPAPTPTATPAPTLPPAAAATGGATPGEG